MGTFIRAVAVILLTPLWLPLAVLVIAAVGAIAALLAGLVTICTVATVGGIIATCLIHDAVYA